MEPEFALINVEKSSMLLEVELTNLYELCEEVNASIYEQLTRLVYKIIVMDYFHKRHSQFIEI